jgi:hypothetical protein
MQDGLVNKSAFIIGPASQGYIDLNSPSQSSIDELDEEGDMIAHRRYKQNSSWYIDEKDILERRSSQMSESDIQVDCPKRPLADVFLMKDATVDEIFRKKTGVDLYKKRIIAHPGTKRY